MTIKTEIVIAIFQPHVGRSADVEELLREHVPTLRRCSYVTERPAVVLKSRIDGTYLEIFEWVSAEAVDRAHDDPRVQEIWRALGEAANFASLDQLQEAGRLFPHFDVVDLRTAEQ